MNLRRVYADICRGYSIAKWDDKDVYIKHLNHADQVDIDEVREAALADAIQRGIKTEEMRLKWLKERGLWFLKDDIALNQQRDYVKGLLQTKTKLVFKAQIEAHNKTLTAEKIKLNEMIAHKEELMDLTAEHVADRKVQFVYISQAFYHDAALSRKMFSREDMYAMDDNLVSELLGLYIDSLHNFSGDNVKTISVSNYFVNNFYLCGDNVTSFFGRPICDLTTQQANLLSYGMYYKNILANNDVPDDLRDKPDKLEEYVHKSAAMRKILDKTSGSGRVGLVMSQEDFKELGLRDDTATIQAEVAKQFKNGMEGANALGYTVK